MQALVDQRGLQRVVLVDSAGTSSFHIGEPADKRMRTAAGRRGLNLTSRSRMVSRRDFSEFDLIIAMDKRNFRELHQLADGSGGKIRLLSDFLDDSWPEEVPDPYYGGEQGFDDVLDMLEAACPKLLEEIIDQD
jgi:protein-tyrosine phosphatase